MMRYLAFRELLLSSASARAAYARLKLELVRNFADDGKAYTDAKEAPVRALLEMHDRREPQ